MIYDFVTRHSRNGTHSLKWDNVLNESDQTAVLPLWVADMDFAAPPAVLQALQARLQHPIFGYTNLPQDYLRAVSQWQQNRYQRDWPTEHLLTAPSVLHALSMAIRALTQPGDRILNLPPIYYPFYKVAQLNGREIIDVPLQHHNQDWHMDFAAIEAQLQAAKASGRPVKALLFCAPHNPTGRVWRRAELDQLANLAIRYDFLILSDEIHADLIAPGQNHISLSQLPQIQDRVLVFASPNKTFNLAGLPISHIYVAHSDLRLAMKRAIEADFYDQPNVLSLTAAWAAYQQAGPWLDELLMVIHQNKAMLDQQLAVWSRQHSLQPALQSTPLEATYLAWVDASGWVRQQGLAGDKELALKMEKIGRVKVSAGSIFQTGGQNHLRFNLACPASQLREALDRLSRVF